jgi:hypothetical protein
MYPFFLFRGIRVGQTRQRLYAAIVGAAVVANTALPVGVSAHEPYEPQHTMGEQTDHDSVPSCGAAAWSSPVVRIHPDLFIGNQADMEDAIRDVNAQIANVGGSTARVEKTVTTSDGFHTTPYYDTSPVIHVGFLNLLPPALAVTSSPWACERFIIVDRDTAWNYGTPQDAGGAGYYMAGKTDPSDNVYFRISYQHELMHAFGVGASDEDAHPDDVYSFLNYGERPWANAPVDAMIRPLPYDVRQLRTMFRASGSRTEVAVLNTWMDKDSTAVVTPQKMLCAPSVGAVANAANAFANFCGEPKATSVCRGDIVQVQYALANYSTEDVDVTSNLWFSTDDKWDPNDRLSPTVKTYTVPAAHSQNKYWGYEAPVVSSGTNFVIVRVTATTPSGVTVKDSIPLTGTVRQASACHSNTPTGGAGTIEFHP